MPEPTALGLAGVQQWEVAPQAGPASGLLERRIEPIARVQLAECPARRLAAFLPLDLVPVSCRCHCQAQLGQVSGVALRIWTTAAYVGCLPPPQHHCLAAEVYLPRADLLLAGRVALAMPGQPLRILPALRAVVARLRRQAAEERTGCAVPAPVAYRWSWLPTGRRKGVAPVQHLRPTRAAADVRQPVSCHLSDQGSGTPEVPGTCGCVRRDLLL
jgi:hypothetical protein